MVPGDLGGARPPGQCESERPYRSAEILQNVCFSVLPLKSVRGNHAVCVDKTDCLGDKLTLSEYRSQSFTPQGATRVLAMTKRIVAVLILILLAGGTASAEQPEKVKETIDFIVQKTTIQRRCGIEYCFQKITFSKSGCDISINQVYSEERFGKTKLVYLTKTNLKALNPDHIIVDENEVRLHTAGGLKTVFISENSESEMTDTAYIFTDKLEDAGAVAKAFKFMIEICGGEGLGF